MSEEKRGKGRPPLETVGDFSHSGPKVARDVFALEAKLGGQRGALAQAIRQVAEERGMPVGTVKKHAQRYADTLREMTEQTHKWSVRFAGLATRMSGFPDDVHAKFGELPLKRGMKLLVDHSIDGTCPAWLVACVRAHDGSACDLMERLEEAAPPRA